MAFKQRSSGPFKMMGSSPVKQDNFNKTGDAASTTPGYKTTKNAKPKKLKSFNTAGSSKAGKLAKWLGKGGKFLSGKTLGIAGMLMATSSKADQPKGEAKKKGSYTDDFTKLKQ